MLEVFRKVSARQNHAQRKWEWKKETCATFSFHCLSVQLRWRRGGGRGEGGGGGGGGGVPSLLSALSCSLQRSPVWWPRPPHTAWPRAPVGGRGGEPHRKQEIMWERARGSRGGERRRQPWCATAATVTRREWENGKLGWLRPAGSVSQLPPRKQRRKFCHIVGTSLLSSPCQHTHPHCHCYCHCSPARASSLSLFCHQIRSVQTRRSPRYDSTWCQLWKAASLLNPLTSMKGRQNSGSHRLPSFLSPCLLLSSYLFEADDCLLLQGMCHLSRRRAARCTLLTHVPQSWRSIPSAVQFVARLLRSEGLYRFGDYLACVLLKAHLKSQRWIAFHSQKYIRDIHIFFITEKKYKEIYHKC